MSESQIRLRDDSGVEVMAIPARSDACAPSVGVLGPSDTATGAAESSSLLKRIVSFPAMLGTLLFGSVFVVGRTFAVDPDLWWHIKNGQNILATHHWPTTDTFSFTVAGHPWISTEWLGDILFAAVASFAGLKGLDALLIILGGTVMVALYVYATLRSANAKAGFVAVTVLLLLATPSFSLRPQMLGYVFLISTLIALELYRQGNRRAIWFLPLLFLIWVNTHGSFVIGMGAMVAYLMGGLVEFRVGAVEARRWTATQRIRLEIVFLLCLVALTLTPYGTQLALYPFHVASSLPVGVANVLEWQPMPFNLLGGKLFLGLVLSFFIVQMVLRLSWRLEELALFLFGTTMACLHVRFLLLFVPFFAPVFATVLSRWMSPYDRSKDRYLLNAALMALVILGIIHYFPANAHLQRRVDASFPVAAVQYLREHPAPSPMFNTYGFGGYLVWSDFKVFVDGRADPYERGGSLGDYFHIARLEPGTLSILRAYGIQSCLLDRREPLATVLRALPDWRQVYADDVAVLFVRGNTTTFTNRHAD